jgi:hypothetical protein
LNYRRIVAMFCRCWGVMSSNYFWIFAKKATPCAS